MPQILIGLLSGIVSGTGMGGGTILIFLLTFFMEIEQHIAQATNLIFFIPTSIVAILVNLKNKNIDLKLAITISICGVIAVTLVNSKCFMITSVRLRKITGRTQSTA